MIWLVVTCILAMLLFCMVATLLGKWASVILTLKYKNWRDSRNTVKKYPNCCFKKRNSKTRSESINSREDSIIDSVTDNLKHDKYNDGYKEPDDKSHVTSLSVPKCISQSQETRR